MEKRDDAKSINDDPSANDKEKLRPDCSPAHQSLRQRKRSVDDSAQQGCSLRPSSQERRDYYNDDEEELATSGNKGAPSTPPPTPSTVAPDYRCESFFGFTLSYVRKHQLLTEVKWICAIIRPNNQFKKFMKRLSDTNDNLAKFV
jgi:hypothetical protein